MQSRYTYIILWGVGFVLFAGVFLAFLMMLKVLLKTVILKVDKKSVLEIHSAEIICGILLAVIVGIRCNCGSDYYNYYLLSVNQGRWYGSFSDIVFSRFQFGLPFLMRGSAVIFQNEFAIFMVVAFITIIPTFYLITKRTQYPILGIMVWILLGYLSMSTNILKQAIAMTMILCFYEKLYNKQYKMVLIYGVLACIFHTASLYIILIILLCRNINFTQKSLLILALISFLFGIGMNPIFSRIVPILPSQYSKYLSVFLNGNQFSIKLVLGGVLVSAFYVFIIWQLIGKADIFDAYTRPIINIMAMCVPILILGVRVWLFNRIAYFGLQFIIYLLPIYIKKSSKSIQKFYYILLVVLCFAFTTLCSENDYYSYNTIYNSKPMSVQEYSYRYQ